jgi:hypothetical protein
MSDEPRIPTVDEFTSALRALHPGLNDFQRKVLLTLRRSAQGAVAVPTVAEQLNAKPEKVNDTIFELCRMLRSELGDDTWPGLDPMQTARATHIGITDATWHWTMGSELDQALEHLGW